MAAFDANFADFPLGTTVRCTYQVPISRPGQSGFQPPFARNPLFYCVRDKFLHFLSAIAHGTSPVLVKDSRNGDGKITHLPKNSEYRSMSIYCTRALFVMILSAAGLACFDANAQVGNPDNQYNNWGRGSTVYGDYMRGQAAYEYASGVATYQRALAYREYVQAQKEREEAAYEWRKMKQIESYEREQRRYDSLARTRERLAAHKQRQAAQAVERSHELVRQIDAGTFVWPESLREKQIMDQSQKVQDTIVNWTGSSSQRYDLLRAAAQIRRAVQQKEIGADHLEREQAIRIVKAIEAFANDPLASVVAMR